MPVHLSSQPAASNLGKVYHSVKVLALTDIMTLLDACKYVLPVNTVLPGYVG